MFTLIEAADRLGVCTETIRRAIKSGELAAVVNTLTRGHRLEVSERDLAAFAARRRRVH